MCTPQKRKLILAETESPSRTAKEEKFDKYARRLAAVESVDVLVATDAEKARAIGGSKVGQRVVAALRGHQRGQHREVEARSRETKTARHRGAEVIWIEH